MALRLGASPGNSDTSDIPVEKGTGEKGTEVINLPAAPTFDIEELPVCRHPRQVRGVEGS